ncbi:MAG: threonine/serine exporter family protein [Sulfurimonas sp.]|jgi:uncharacterized membrane protein YjjB (DUF3815 family)
MINNILLATSISIAFAILFNAPKRALLPIVLLGIVALLVRTYMLEYGLSIEFSTFIASFSMGIICIFFSNKQNIPILVYAISSSIVLVPTMNAYKAMIGLLQISTNHIMDQTLIIQTLHYSLKTWFIFGAIAIGIIIPTQFISKHRFKIL